jgi:hypothetical protein
MDYYEKYLKYKNKYLELKSQIGGEDEACPIVRREDKFCKELNPALSKMFNYLSYAYACTTKPNLVNLKSNQDKLLEEMKTQIANKKRIGGENDIYFKVLEEKYKESKDKIYGKLASDLFDYLKKDGVRVNKDQVEKIAPTLTKAFGGITQKKLGSMWVNK